MNRNWTQLGLFATIFVAFGVFVTCFAQGGKEYPLKLQPELDILNVESYLSNPRLVKLQLQCILYDGPCDVVGRWAKPRVKAGLLGQCLKCTEKQKGWLNKWLERLINENPELYRAGIAKFINGTGVKISQEEVDRISKTLEQDIELEESNSTISPSS